MSRFPLDHDRRAPFRKSARSPTLPLLKQLVRDRLPLPELSDNYDREKRVWEGFGGALGLLGTRSRVWVKEADMN